MARVGGHGGCVPGSQPRGSAPSLSAEEGHGHPHLTLTWRKPLFLQELLTVVGSRARSASPEGTPSPLVRGVRGKKLRV